ncbi:Zn-dependent hydroxyacylglutathione hydrolase [Indibacter alkaliphilus LW1]|uniref:Zn-dependent hydroxyacylglutathione hydrolase n=1 Tax=Indibacter alkaliphilus (strain CCUG 57479 / KCTC 22604 / LW1) TaxID=1189612 RepID=S2D2X8_INDAL|nr:MBL fold metallo-hydrolase [Indibacter alkaliphilus]EOZ93657.1 Zn-dependent hydroxyacylglutathione hydrolase [Indibacter alkaliphilus LW1]
MFFELVYDKSLAQASYVIGCQAGGIAAVIDPKRDVDTYLKVAEANNLKITHILETHIHADFLSGSRELAALTGAELYLSDEGDENWKYEFPHKKLKHGDIIKLGNITFEALHTPGHTPEHLSFLLTDKPASKEPVMLFTGDFVFVGDVGRPDLLEQAAGIKGTQELGAGQMFDSLQDFNKMPEFIQVWPGHGAGSACGKALGAVPMTTVGYEKIRNWALQMLNDKAAFSKELLADQPEPPKYFAMMKKLNKVERNLLTEVPSIPNLSESEFLKAKENGLAIIDTRPWKQYADGFLKGTLNITNNNSFSTWMGWYMDYESDFILIAEENEVEDLTRKLIRIGLDNFIGYLTPAQLIHFEGENLQTYSPVDKETVKAKLANEDVQLIDVRGKSEFKNGHIDGAENLFVGKLNQNLDKISKEKEVIIHCQSGARAAIAYSLLVANGFDNIVNYSGGWADWTS